MKRLILALAMVVMVSPAIGGEFEDAAKAYTNKDFVTAFRKYKALAERGFAQAMFNIGRAYIVGEGVQLDYVAGHMWLNLAAQGGHRKARAAQAFVEANFLPSYEVTRAKKLARKCIEKQYKGC